MNNAPGKGLLKVTGILFVIFAGISLIGAIIMVAGGAILGAAVGGGAGAALAGVIILAVVLAFLLAILELIAGIFGIKNCDKPEKSTVCIVFGAIILALTIINIIASGFLWTSLFGIVLPILYFVGAIMNKNAQTN